MKSASAAGNRIPVLGIAEVGVYRTPESVARQLGFNSIDVWRDWLKEQGFSDYLDFFDRIYLNAGTFSEKRDRP